MNDADTKVTVSVLKRLIKDIKKRNVEVEGIEAGWELVEIANPDAASTNRKYIGRKTISITFLEL